MGVKLLVPNDPARVSSVCCCCCCCTKWFENAMKYLSGIHLTNNTAVFSVKVSLKCPQDQLNVLSGHLNFLQGWPPYKSLTRILTWVSWGSGHTAYCPKDPLLYLQCKIFLMARSQKVKILNHDLHHDTTVICLVCCGEQGVVGVRGQVNKKRSSQFWRPMVGAQGQVECLTKVAQSIFCAPSVRRLGPPPPLPVCHQTRGKRALSQDGDRDRRVENETAKEGRVLKEKEYPKLKASMIWLSLIPNDVSFLASKSPQTWSAKLNGLVAS